MIDLYIMYPLVAIAMTGVDFLFAEYTKSCADRKAFKASLFAAGLILVSGFVTTSYVHDPWLLIPVMVGSFMGTWISIKFFK